jgi:hypothetical protein
VSLVKGPVHALRNALWLALQAADVVASLVVSLQANQFLQPGTTPFVAAVQTMHSGHPVGGQLLAGVVPQRYASGLGGGV